MFLQVFPGVSTTKWKQMCAHPGQCLLSLFTLSGAGKYEISTGCMCKVQWKQNYYLVFVLLKELFSRMIE